MNQVAFVVCCAVIEIPERITIVPCPEKHKFHRIWLERWLDKKANKCCPYHGHEIIL